MALGLQTKTEAAQRQLVPATHDTFIQGVLAKLDTLQTDSVIQKPRTKKETGQSVADTRAQQKEQYKIIDNAYDKEVEAMSAMAATGRITPSVYSDAQARTEGDKKLSKTDAAAVGQSQTYANTMLNNPRFDNSKIGEDPNLSFAEEVQMLETFAQQAGVSPEQVGANPRLYEAFGRYLGMATGTLNNEKYLAYDVNGDNLKDANGNYFKAWTPYVQPKFVSQATEVSTKIKDNLYAQRFRGNRQAYIDKEVAQGTEEDVAAAAWDQQGDIDINESLILKAGFPEDDATVIRAADMASKMAKTLRSFVRSIHASGMSTSPLAASRFAEKITGKRYDEFKGESVNDMINLFMYSYAALEEKSEGAAQAFADMIMLGVFDHALNNVYRYQDKKDDPQAEGAIENETTEDAIKRFDRTLMTGATDQKAIGRTILTNMGFGKTTPEQQEAMGAMAMDMVFKTFKENQSINKEDALFRKVEHEAVVDGVKRTFIAHTFTKRGLAIAQDMKGLFEVIMPKSQRLVRYGTLLTDRTAYQ